jgi:hypothetical protein
VSGSLSNPAALPLTGLHQDRLQKLLKKLIENARAEKEGSVYCDSIISAPHKSNHDRAEVRKVWPADPHTDRGSILYCINNIKSA